MKQRIRLRARSRADSPNIVYISRCTCGGDANHLVHSRSVRVKLLSQGFKGANHVSHLRASWVPVCNTEGQHCAVSARRTLISVMHDDLVALPLDKIDDHCKEDEWGRNIPEVILQRQVSSAGLQRTVQSVRTQPLQGSTTIWNEGVQTQHFQTSERVSPVSRLNGRMLLARKPALKFTGEISSHTRNETIPALCA